MQIYKERTEYILYFIHSLGDPVYQKNIWVEAKGPEVDCFEETINLLYDDMCFEDFIFQEMRIAGFSQRLQNKMKRLHDLLESLPDYEIDAELIKTPKWEEVVKVANSIVPVFRTEIDSLNLPSLDDGEENDSTI